MVETHCAQALFAKAPRANIENSLLEPPFGNMQPEQGNFKVIIIANPETLIRLAALGTFSRNAGEGLGRIQLQGPLRAPRERGDHRVSDGG